MYSYTYINEQTYNIFLKQKTKNAKILCVKSLYHNVEKQKWLSDFVDFYLVATQKYCVSKYYKQITFLGFSSR